MLGGNSMQNTLPETTKIHISAASWTDTGRVRTHNEDTIALCEPPEQAVSVPLGWLYLLADGVGGQAAGEVASRMAVETISSLYYDLTTARKASANVLPSQDIEVKNLDGPLHDLDDPVVHIRRAFFAAHMRLRELAALKQEYAGMATTCLAAVVKGAHLLVAHVGDSRAYLIRTSPGSSPTLTRLTTDHSMVTELVRAGVITPEQMQSSPARHIILRALGGSKQDNPCPDVTTCMVRTGDQLVLCCDGLWSMLTEERIALVVNSNPPWVACNELIRLANEAGGEDNISVVVLSFI
jgi:serine/threonine protein phosphatase PrpC